MDRRCGTAAQARIAYRTEEVSEAWRSLAREVCAVARLVHDRPAGGEASTAHSLVALSSTRPAFWLPCLEDPWNIAAPLKDAGKELLVRLGERHVVVGGK